MKRTFSSLLLTGLFLWIGAASASAITMVDNATLGYYNDSLGTVLNGTSAYFPCDYQTCGDPTFDPITTAPSLTAAADVLGNWLDDPAHLNSNWSGPQAIPLSWTINDETAIVYKIDAGATGLINVDARFGVDNGIFVWLDGQFLGGQLRPGGVSLGELTLTGLTAIDPGVHFLQVLREDHGGSDGYSVSITGDVAPVPEPGTMILLGSGLVGLAGYGRKRKK